MEAATLVLFMLMVSSVHVGKSATALISVKCEPAVGVVGQITRISCSIKSEDPKTLNVYVVTLARLGEENFSFAFDPRKKLMLGDSRFELENQVSLQLHNTNVSDEGEYDYLIRTNQGSDITKVTINVTAKYSKPVISSEKEDDGAANLLCMASGGYPAGFIHWFDRSNTNWTKSATLHTTQGDDGLFNLSSKLSFEKFDSLWEPFRCIVLNSKYGIEGEAEERSNLKLNRNDEPVINKGISNNTVAAVVVIGSLIIGLLIVILFKQRRVQQRRRSSTIPILSPNPMEDTNAEEEDALNDPVYGKSAETDHKIEV